MQPVRKLTPPPPPPVDIGTLGLLRSLAGQSRPGRFEDPETLCALLQICPAAAAEAYGTALMRLLPRALGRKVVFHRPGAEARSFDETWVLGLIRTVRAGDEDSLRFALASRVERRFHRPVRYLVEGFAARIDSVSAGPIQGHMRQARPGQTDVRGRE